MEISTLTINAPDDFHTHFRDSFALLNTVPSSAYRFRRALVMPNLRPAVLTADNAVAYKQRIEQALRTFATQKSLPVPNFQPLMTLYLTEKTTPEMIEQAKATKEAQIVACKLYPAGATTNSSEGVTNIKVIYPTLRKMAECGMLLLVHSEVTDKNVDIFEREEKFIERELRPLRKDIPNLRIVMEHVTTKQGVEFVEQNENMAATITCHHLLCNRNDLFVGGMQPHYFCLPVLKSEEHRQALLRAATSGSPKFFAGTDSAPHARHAKEATCCAAGCYTAFAGIELYTEAFWACNAIDKLDNFLSKYGAEFYGLPLNSGEKIALIREPWTVPSTLPFGDNDVVVPFYSGRILQWRMQSPYASACYAQA